MTENKPIPFKEHFAIIKHLIRWTLMAVPVAIVIGSVVAFFLWLLTTSIHFRFSHPWLLFLLPVAQGRQRTESTSER